MAHHDNEDHDEEDGQLLGDGALIGQTGEGAGNEEGQDGDDHPGDDIQHDALELLQHIGDGFRFGPGSRQTNQHREHQGGHDAHDGVNGQGEQQLRSIPQALGRRLDGQVGDNGKARSHRHQGRTNGRAIRQHQGQAQHPGGIALQAGDGGGNKSDDDQGHAEVNQRTQQFFDGENDLYHGGIGHQAHHDAHDHADQEPEGQTARQFFHTNTPIPQFFQAEAWGTPAARGAHTSPVLHCTYHTIFSSSSQVRNPSTDLACLKFYTHLTSSRLHPLH